MVKVEAYVRTHLLQDLQEALEALHISGLTVSDVRGSGHSKGVTHTFRGSQYTTSLTPRVKVELLLTDDELDPVLDIIKSKAHTGEVGDGKIVIYPVKDVIRIRTGERGETALK
jgi:nitrogen regulatory protein P-II 1